MELFKTVIVLLSMSILFANGQVLSENDLNRIVYLKGVYSGNPSSRFFLFSGFDEQDRMLFTPLSGTRNKRILKSSQIILTDYSSSTNPFEIVLDAYYSFPAMPANFNRCKELLRTFGTRDCILSLLDTEKYLRKFSTDSAEIEKGFARLIDVLKQKKSKKENQKEKPRRRRGCNSRACKPAEQIDEDEEQEKFQDFADISTQKLSKDIEAINNIVDQELRKDRLLAALSIYLKMKRSIPENSSELSFYGPFDKDKDLFAEYRKNLSSLLDRQREMICTKLQERYANMPLRDQFVKRFPEEKGLWSESPPVSNSELCEFFTRFYQTYRESQAYSPISDLEKWGNCRLTLLLCTKGQSEADYLEKEFLDWMQRNLKR